MKKLVVLSAVLFLAAFILLPGSCDGKYNVSKPIIAASSLSPFALVADGGPMPPFPPNPSAALTADGGPMPPFPPNPSATLMADGGPMPPFPPNPSRALCA